jgi:hypothetical protein
LLINELSNQRHWKENAILQSWGGAISMVSKNWWLFGAGLSSFWHWEKRVRGWPEQKILIGFPPEQKEGKEWAGPPTIARASTVAPEPLPFTALTYYTSLLERATLCLFNRTCCS